MDVISCSHYKYYVDKWVVYGSYLHKNYFAWIGAVGQPAFWFSSDSRSQRYGRLVRSITVSCRVAWHN